MVKALDPTVINNSLARMEASKVLPLDAVGVVAALGALAHDHRMAAYRLLMEAGADGLPAGTIAEKLGFPPYSLSSHLMQLMRGGLVSRQRRSQQIIYATIPSTMEGLVSYLTENCRRQMVACQPTCTSSAGHAPKDATTAA